MISESWSNAFVIGLASFAAFLAYAIVVFTALGVFGTIQDIKEADGKPPKRKRNRASQYTVQRHTSKNPSVTVLQDGRAAHVFIDHGREYATVTLDSDTPLTDSDVECIVKDIKKFKAEKENENG